MYGLVALVAVILYKLLGPVVPVLAHVLGGVCINDSKFRQIDTVTAKRHKFNLSAGRKSKSVTFTSWATAGTLLAARWVMTTLSNPVKAEKKASRSFQRLTLPPYFLTSAVPYRLVKTSLANSSNSLSSEYSTAVYSLPLTVFNTFVWMKDLSRVGRMCMFCIVTFTWKNTFEGVPQTQFQKIVQFL